MGNGISDPKWFQVVLEVRHQKGGVRRGREALRHPEAHEAQSGSLRCKLNFLRLFLFWSKELLFVCIPTYKFTLIKWTATWKSRMHRPNTRRQLYFWGGAQINFINSSLGANFDHKVESWPLGGRLLPRL
jgi:hypothetical protein